MNSREKQSLLDDVFLQAGGAPFRPEYKLSIPWGALPFRAFFVQSHDMLYKTSRDILYTPALVRPARREQGCRGRQ
jgi:hypothetical protein